ncbi:hypothetical protein FQR65_LT00059 [Abscondita terminalis]|nr:hypothetical protein FQR65_LT00059 [Abscondita terminalis]
MWFVSQIQNALSGNEPNEQCFMDSDRGTTEEQTPSNKKPNPKSHIKSSKPSTPKNQYLTRKYHDVGKKTSNNFLYSTECMELPSTSFTHKRYSAFEPEKLSGEGVRSETKECAVPRLLDKAPSDDVVPLKRESSRICIKTAPSRPNYNSKISFTSLNYVHDLARSKMSRSSLRQDMSYMNSSACNELDICCTSNEIESVSRPSSAKKCTQCDSVTTITCTNCNKIEKSDVSKDDSVSDITVRFKPEILKSSKDSSKLKKPEPVCVYKRDKKGADANVRRSFRTKKKTDDKIEKKIPVPMNQSKIEVITKSGNEKIHEHTKKEFVRSKAQYQKRNELPIHLRPLSPVHNLQPNVFRKSSNIFDDVMPEKSNIKSIYANEPECTSPAYDSLCKKICLNNCGCKDMSTSMDFEDLSEEKMLPITTYRYNAKTRPSSVSRLTKIPVPNTTYCVGYSKISSVQEKVSYITGSHSQDLGNILYCQEDEFKPCKGSSIETPNICQKRIIQRPRSNIQPKRSNLTDPKINKKLTIENEVSLTKPTDLIKRIEMIRRKLAEADCGDTNVEDKNISLKRSRLFYRHYKSGIFDDYRQLNDLKSSAAITSYSYDCEQISRLTQQLFRPLGALQD